MSLAAAADDAAFKTEMIKFLIYTIKSCRVPLHILHMIFNERKKKNVILLIYDFEPIKLLYYLLYTHHRQLFSPTSKMHWL